MAKDQTKVNVTDLDGDVHSMTVANAFDMVNHNKWTTAPTSKVQPQIKSPTDDVVKAAKKVAKEDAAAAAAAETADEKSVVDDETPEDIAAIKEAAGTKAVKEPEVVATEKVVEKAEAKIPDANTGKAKAKK